VILAELWQDLRYAARTLRKSPAFTAVAVATLALGIGASTAIWSVASGVLLRPLPYRDPDQLVTVWMDNTRMGLAEDWHSFPAIEDYREQSTKLADLAMFNQASATFTGTADSASGGGEPEWARGAYSSANLWDVLGVQPALGRVFVAEEDRPGADDVVMLAHDFWLRRFGGREDVIGTTVEMNERRRRIVGVMPAGFDFPARGTAFWVPTAASEEMRASRGSLWLQAIGRLRPDATRDQAQAELERINAGMQQRFPEEKGFGVNVVEYREQLVGSIRPAILVLLAAVAFVLLIACANVAGLLLARGSARGREMALRLAIGAGRGRLVRQLLTESVLLAVVGGAAGVLLARVGLDALLAVAPPDLPRLDHIALDGGVLAFAVALSLVAGIAFGLAPAIELARAGRPAEALKEGGRSSSASGLRLRRALVVAEVAVAVTLLVGAGLLVRSFLELLDVDLGFRVDHLLTARVSLDRERYGDDATSLDDPRLDQATELFRELIERAEALPSIEGAAGVTDLFLSATPNSTIFTIEGRPAPRPEDRVEVPFDAVTTHYFRVMQIPLLAGRFFDARDAADGAAAVIINASLARRFFAGDDPIGKRIRYGVGDSEAPWMTIVGVVGDTRRTGFDAAVRPETYLPHAQAPARTLELLLRTSGPPEAAIPDLRSVLRSLDPAVPLQSPRALSEVVADMTAQRRLNTLLMTVLAALAVLVAAVGIYGVIAYSVVMRNRELGVRAALGASPRSTLRLVLVEGLALTAAGLGLGLLLAAALSRLMSSLLYGVSASDPATFAGAALAAVVTTVAACLVPAARAMRVDPVRALRAE
jgi:putative ABC transport system permease protein